MEETSGSDQIDKRPVEGGQNVPLIIAIFIGLQAFAITDVLAWSPLEACRSHAEPFPERLWLTAANDDNTEKEQIRDPHFYPA